MGSWEASQPGLSVLWSLAIIAELPVLASDLLRTGVIINQQGQNN